MNPFESVLQKAEGAAVNVGKKASAVGKSLTNAVGNGVKNFMAPKLVKKTPQNDPYGLSPISNVPKYTNNQRQQLDEINRLTK